MPEQLYDVYAKRNPETGEPLLGDCNLHLGDGTLIVTFTKGFAKVDRETAELLHKIRKDVDVPALSGGAPGITGDPLDQLTPEERAAVEALRAQQATDPNPAGQQPVEKTPSIEEDDAAELDEREPVPVPAPPPAVPPHGAEPLEPGTPEHDAALADAKAHLEEEGVEVPETVADPAAPGKAAVDTHGEALVAKTDDGESARCQALKTDGKQCNNPAADGPTCNLPGHVTQLQDAKPAQ